MSFEPQGLPAGTEVLLAEDDAILRRRLASHLAAAGAAVSEAGSLAEARRLLREIRFDFAAMDLHLPDGEGLDLLREGAFSENTEVVVMTAFGGVRMAVEAMRLGACDYLAKPFEAEELTLAFLRSRSQRKAARREELKTREDAGEAEGLIFGESLAGVRAQLESILATERRMERSLPPVLIEGETGTGKTALARWIQSHGPRSASPMVTVNCAALPENLAESELFGHERGAFTDAKQARIGLFEAADHGTLFLDEIGSLSPAIQAKVLLAVEEGKIRRIGGTREKTVDTRVIAASNRPLEKLVESGAFREDLYQRLNLLRLTLPPLRERGQDVIAIAKALLRRIAARHRLKGIEITQAGQARLLAQPWKGNIRELAHEIERAIIFGDGGALEFTQLGALPSTATPPWRNPSWQMPQEGFRLDSVVEELISEALLQTHNNVSAAARRLGVTRDFLRYRLEAKPEGESGTGSG